MDDDHTAILAGFVSSVEYEDIPAPVRDHAKLLILDSLGCALFGSTLPWSRLLVETLRTSEGKGPTPVWGTDFSLAVANAAMANATAVHGFELDDVGAGQHNGSVVLPAALAAATLVGGISGKQLITAVVAGSECAAHVQGCIGRAPQVDIGFHVPSLTGIFGACASASSVLGLSATQVVHALAHAAQQASGIMANQHGGMGKRLLAGKAAHGGTFAALLAYNGFTNVERIFERSYGGFCSTFSGARDTYDLERLSQGLGSQWLTTQSNFKMWACRVPIHPALEALRHLQETAGLRAEEVESIELSLDSGAYKAVGWEWEPTSVTSAQMNLQYCVAMLLLEGDVFVDQFEEEKLARPDVLEFVKRVRPVHDPGMDRSGLFQRKSNIVVKTKDGRRLRASGELRGEVEGTVSRDDVVAKFGKLISNVLNPDVADHIIIVCDRLEQEPNINESLLSALGATSVRTVSTG